MEGEEQHEVSFTADETHIQLLWKTLWQFFQKLHKAHLRIQHHTSSI